MMHHPWLQVALALLAGLPLCVGQQVPNPPSSQSSASHWINSAIDLSVVDSSGAPVPKTEITIVDGAGEQIANGKTDRRGEFLVEQVPPGAYRVTACLGGFKKQAATVLVRQNWVAEVTLKLEEAALRLEDVPRSDLQIGESDFDLVVTDENGAILRNVTISLRNL